MPTCRTRASTSSGTSTPSAPTGTRPTRPSSCASSRASPSAATNRITPSTPRRTARACWRIGSSPRARRTCSSGAASAPTSTTACTWPSARRCRCGTTRSPDRRPDDVPLTGMSETSIGAPGSARRYLHSLWLLSARDLRVRYATSWLGYLWSVLDPLLMSLIYWFVFTQVFSRTVGEQPYIVFLISALLPWVWFNSAVTDFTRAFSRDSKLVRSTAIPRSIWVNRIVLSKGIEFLCSLPVLAAFAIFAGATVSWQLLWFPVAVLLQAVLLVGLGLLVAPLCALYADLERTTRLILRVLFYASPIIYAGS